MIRFLRSLVVAVVVVQCTTNSAKKNEKKKHLLSSEKHLVERLDLLPARPAESHVPNDRNRERPPLRHIRLASQPAVVKVGGFHS